jgi:hypothetical protein
VFDAGFRRSAHMCLLFITSRVRDLESARPCYWLGTGSFVVGYFLFEVPSNSSLERIGAPLESCVMIVGLLSSALSFVGSATSYGG